MSDYPFENNWFDFVLAEIKATMEFRPFLIVPPKHDIVVTAVSTASNTAVNLSFFGFFANINQ